MAALSKFFWFILGILLIPLGIGYSFAFYKQLMLIQQARGPELSLLLGTTLYCALHALQFVPERIYVFGHELMHAFAIWLTGGEVSGFKVGKDSGAVTTTGKITGFVALAPYVVPIYAVVWSLLYGAIALFVDVRPYAQWFFFGLGVTMAFHLIFTINTLKTKQTDLDVLGPLVSFGIIYWMNLSLVLLIIGLVIPEIHFVQYLESGVTCTIDLYHAVTEQLFAV